MMLGVAAIALVLWAMFRPANAEILAYPTPSAELCSVYRQGPVVHQRMPIYYAYPSEDPESFYWVDVWFRPEYLFDPALEGLPRPDGLPERDLLFDLDITTGQPLPLDYRRSVRPQDKTFFSLLLNGGRNHLPNSRMVSIIGASEIGRTWKRTGEFFYSFEKTEIVGPVRPQAGRPRDDVFVAPAADGDVAVMGCSPKGFDRVPSCQVYEKAKLFSMNFGEFRMNQLDELKIARQHAQNFTACLTWNGEE
jgi:hypothetical protein